MDASYFREKAQHCRKMANIAVTPDLRAELLKFAEEFDGHAAKLDLAMAGNKPTAS
jgi:hypothetical protein